MEDVKVVWFDILTPVYRSISPDTCEEGGQQGQ